MTPPYRELHGRAELLRAYRDDPFVSCFGVAPVRAFASEHAAAWVCRRDFGPVLMAHGAPAESASLVAHMASLTPVRRLLIPDATLARLPRRLQPGEVNRWHWFYTRTAPPIQPGEPGCEWLPTTAHPEVTALLGAAFPDASSWPREDETDRRWFGARGTDGRLVACGVASWRDRTAPGLGSIAVHPDARRRGLGASLTAWVTRTLLDSGNRLVTLGSWVGEDATHRIYRRLGYQDPHVMASGSLND